MIKRKDGRWQDQVRLPGMKTPKYFYGKTQSEVKKKMAAFREGQEKGPLFEACLDEWDRWHESQISPSSVHSYTKSIEDVREYFKGDYLREIRANHVYAFLQWLAGKDLAKKTVNARLNVLNMVFDYAILHSYCEVNPCGPVKLPKGLKSGKRELPPEDVLRTIAAAEKKDGMLFAAILLYTGLRRGELLGLRWEDIDRKAGVIHVRRSVYYEGGSPRLKTPKTQAGERDVWIVDKLAEFLPKSGKGYVFGGVSPLTDSELTHMWYAMCRDNGWLDKNYRCIVTPHQLRHAFATALFEAGVDETDAKDVMGHSSIQVTRDIYTHIRNKRRKTTAEKMNKYYEKDCQTPVNDDKVVDIQNLK